MMYEANREIRLMEERDLARQRRPTARDAMRYLDDLIEALEEMNLSDLEEIPPGFSSQLGRLKEFLPVAALPNPWPRRVIAILDQCFELQAKLLTGQARGAA